VTVFTTAALGVPWLLARTGGGRLDPFGAERPRAALRHCFAPPAGAAARV
jgi:hypothetical protein